MSDHAITHVESHDIGAFVIHEDQKRIAEMVYRRLGEDHILVEHTKVDESLRGQGIARRLLDTLVAWARANAQRVSATCPYARAQFEKDTGIQDVYVA